MHKILHSKNSFKRQVLSDPWGFFYYGDDSNYEAYIFEEVILISVHRMQKAPVQVLVLFKRINKTFVNGLY